MATKKESEERPKGGLDGLLSGLTDLVGKLVELTEKGEELSRKGSIEIGGRGGQAKNLRGVYGFSVKTGIGKKGVRVEPFGNIRRNRKTGESVVQELHEPMTDLFEEDDHILIVAEMPGVEAEDVKIDLHGDILTLSAEGEDHKYRKEMLLPGEFDPDKMKVSCKNGIVKITCMK